jgi:oxysterol 7-alpha-hydroxylase
MDVDGAGLRSNTFMQALWREALRVGTAAAPARVVMEDTELEGYVVRKGSVVLMPTALLHHDPALFPDSDKVDVKRWMDEASAVIQVSPSEIDDQKGLAHVEADEQQQRQRSIRTFGGGMGMCSGRYAAEQEIIGIVSKLLLLFDVEWEGRWNEEFVFNPRSIGIMHPARHPMVRLRRRM